MLDYGDKAWIRNMVENAEGRASLRMDLIEDWIGMNKKDEPQEEDEKLFLVTMVSDRFSPDNEEKKIRIVNGHKEKNFFGFIYQPCLFDMRTHTPKFAETNLTLTFRYIFATTDLRERLLEFGNSHVIGEVRETDREFRDVKLWKPEANNFHVRWKIKPHKEIFVGAPAIQAGHFTDADRSKK